VYDINSEGRKIILFQSSGISSLCAQNPEPQFAFEKN